MENAHTHTHRPNGWHLISEILAASEMIKLQQKNHLNVSTVGSRDQF